MGYTKEILVERYVIGFGSFQRCSWSSIKNQEPSEYGAMAAYNS